MTVTVYRSTDASAPVLTGQVGSLITLLDAVLVNGYGAKAAAGWSKPYSGTNLAVYRGPAVGGSPELANRRYLRVDDNLGTPYIAKIHAYLTMSDANTGTGRFPNLYSTNPDLYMRKSGTANSTARPWTIVADAQAFYYISACGQTVYGNSDSQDSAVFFGDFTSHVPGDTLNTMLVGMVTVTVNPNNDLFGFIEQNALAFNPSAAHYMAGPYHGCGAATLAVFTDRRFAAHGATLGCTAGGTDYPDPVRGGLILDRVDVLERASSVNATTRRFMRGYMPGLWAADNRSSPGSLYDTFDGTGYFAGKSFITLPVYNSSVAGIVYLETTNTWR